MFRLTLKELAAKKMRLLATAIAVIIGVAFLAGTLTLTDTVMGTFDNLLAEADAGTDAYVRGSSPLELGFGESRPRIDAALVEQLRHVDGVDAVATRVTGYAQILDVEGKAVGNAQTGVMGMNWSPVDELNPFRLAHGRRPTAPTEIVIDQHSADVAGLSVGDHTTVLTKQEPFDATIVGIAKFGSADSPGGTAMVLFDDATAQSLLAEPGKVDGAAFVARADLSADELVANLTPYIGDANEVITGAQLTKEDQDQLHDDIAAFGLFMTIFAGIAMFVAAFIINNTFSIIVTQRSRDMALLRAIGASGRQVRRAVLGEAAVIGVVASTVGLAAGVGVAKALQALLGAAGLDIPTDTPVVTTSTVVISVVTGLLVTILSAVLPARRASRIPPIAALREVAQDRSATAVRRTATGISITAASGALLTAGVRAEDVKLVGLGALGLVVATSVLGPVVARPAAGVLGFPIAKLRGMSGVLARHNAMRQPKRTTRTAASLMIGVGLVAFITIFAASLKASTSGAFEDDYRGTHVVDSGAYDGTMGLSPQLATDLSQRPEVSAVSVERIAHVQVDGTDHELFRAFDTTTIGTLFDLGTVQGDIERLGDNGIAVAADSGNVAPKLGDTRELTFTTGTKTFVVRAIYDASTEFLTDQFVDIAALEANVPSSQLDAKVYVATTDPDVLDTATAGYPTATVMDVDEFIDHQAGKVDVMLKLIYALLGLALVITLLGIANTLSLSIHERTRELGLLRAVGMSRAQVRASVRWESVVVALFGSGLGVALGSFLGWVMVGTLADQGIDQLVIPAAPLALITAIAGTAGIAAAVMPARKAARTNILAALSST